MSAAGAASLWRARVESNIGLKTIAAAKERAKGNASRDHTSVAWGGKFDEF
jgi:hypothetical protein